MRNLAIRFDLARHDYMQQASGGYDRSSGTPWPKAQDPDASAISAVAGSPAERSEPSVLQDLTIAFQPIVAPRAGRLPCVEALVRHCRPDGSDGASADFLAEVQEPDLIRQIDLHVLDRAIRTARLWRRAGVPFGLIAVNAVAADLETPDYVGRVLDAIDGGALQPADICIEVNELVVLDGEHSAVLAQVRRLAEAGVTMALDDFGKGFASLLHLRDLPIAVVKIDRCFVGALAASEASRSLVKGVIAMAHALGKTVVAEGVETVEQAAILAGYGCDLLQGFLFSRGVAAPSAAEFLRRWLVGGVPTTILPASGLDLV